MEFPWWIFFGTIVTFSVAILFRTGRNIIRDRVTTYRRQAHRAVAVLDR